VRRDEPKTNKMLYCSTTTKIYFCFRACWLVFVNKNTFLNIGKRDKGLKGRQYLRKVMSISSLFFRQAICSVSCSAAKLQQKRPSISQVMAYCYVSRPHSVKKVLLRLTKPRARSLQWSRKLLPNTSTSPRIALQQSAMTLRRTRTWRSFCKIWRT